MSVLNKLTEGIVDRDLGKEGAALLTKWERTGLLEGLDSDHTRSTMARLLENQAKELLREASTMAGGDVEGFAAVAFPIVRRVFGSLIANDLVSVQPMSLPSGLIFFMDFKHTNARLMKSADDSLYGGGVLGQQITGGVDLSSDDGDSGFYNLSNGYSSPTGSIAFGALTLHPIAHGMGHGVEGSEAGGDICLFGMWGGVCRGKGSSSASQGATHHASSTVPSSGQQFSSSCFAIVSSCCC